MAPTGWVGGARLTSGRGHWKYYVIDAQSLKWYRFRVRVVALGGWVGGARLTSGRGHWKYCGAVKEHVCIGVGFV